MNLFQAILKLTADVKSGAPISVLWADVKAIGDLVIGVDGFAAGPDQDLKAALADAETALNERLASAGPQEVGKWGDGTFLKLMLEVLLKYGPLFI